MQLTPLLKESYTLLAAVQVGCRKYQDQDWLRVVRRWPPAMVQRMNDFLTFSPAGGAAAGAGAAALQG